MINKLTQQEVSKEMLDVLKRLERNEDVPYNEIKDLKEVKVAYSCINNSTPTINLKNREELHEGLIYEIEKRGSIHHDENGDIEFTGEIKRDKRIDIVIGLPAAGKSSTLVEPISEEYGSRVVDSDEIKKLIPEFNKGWGAEVVHEESKMINAKVLINALENGENIVLPLVGSKLESLMEKVELCKDVNYKVYVHYNELPMNKAIGRVLTRYLEEARFVDPKILYEYGNNVEKVYEQIKTKGEIVDGYSKFSNDVKRGERPKLIEQHNCEGGIWRNDEYRNAESYSNNKGNVRGQRELHNGSNENSSKEDKRERSIKKEIVAAGYKPNKKLIENIIKLEKISGKKIKINKIKSIVKTEKSSEVKDIMKDILRECQKQERVFGVER